MSDIAAAVPEQVESEASAFDLEKGGKSTLGESSDMIMDPEIRSISDNLKRSCDIISAGRNDTDMEVSSESQKMCFTGFNKKRPESGNKNVDWYARAKKSMQARGRDMNLLELVVPQSLRNTNAEMVEEKESNMDYQLPLEIIDNTNFQMARENEINKVYQLLVQVMKNAKVPMTKEKEKNVISELLVDIIKTTDAHLAVDKDMSMFSHILTKIVKKTDSQKTEEKDNVVSQLLTEIVKKTDSQADDEKDVNVDSQLPEKVVKKTDAWMEDGKEKLAFLACGKDKNAEVNKIYNASIEQLVKEIISKGEEEKSNAEGKDNLAKEGEVKAKAELKKEMYGERETMYSDIMYLVTFSKVRNCLSELTE